MNLVEKMGHPEPKTQRLARCELLNYGPKALKALGAALERFPASAHPTIIEVLGQIKQPSARLRLMRYLFDTRQRPDLSATRAQAMQALMGRAEMADNPRFFAFLEDMRDDPDELLRTFIVEALAQTTDPRALGLIRRALADPSLYVRERARRSFLEVQETQKIDPLELSGPDFLRTFRLLSAAGRRELAALIPAHRAAFEIACALVRYDSPHAMIGLEVLGELGRPSAREVALRHFLLSDSQAERAASLRVIAIYLQADASGPEARAIAEGLRVRDKFVHLAALEAAGRSGHPQLTMRALRATRAEDVNTALVAAQALQAVATTLPAEVADELLKSVMDIRQRREREDENRLARCEIALNSTLSILSRL